MIDKKTIQHMAKLARIKLTDREELKMQDDLSAILGYIEQLNKVNTDGIEPLYQTTGLVNSTRPDNHRQDFKLDEVLNKELIGQAPDKEKGFFKVKSILKK